MTIGHLSGGREEARSLEARELRYFLAVADELHFGRAARRLSIAASALSRGISRVETDLGVALFVRDTHGVQLTTAGRVLLGRARDAVANLDEALAATREAGRLELTGLVRVGVTPLMRHRLGPAIFERFAAVYPAVRVAHREELSGPLVEELSARRIDVALAFCPPRREGLTYEPIRDAALAVLIESGHPLARRASVSLRELRDEAFLLPSAAGAPAVRERFAALFEEAGFEPRYASREVDNDEEMSAVREGCGVEIVSRFFLEVVPTGVVLLALDPPAPLDFELVRREEPPTPGLARFMEVVREVGLYDLQTTTTS